MRLRESAVRFRERYPGWRQYGVSGYYAAGDADVDAICAEKLPMWETVTIYRVEDLIAHQLDVAATFRTPHVTVLHPDIEELVRRLARAPHENRPNRYNEHNAERRQHP